MVAAWAKFRVFASNLIEVYSARQYAVCNTEHEILKLNFVRESIWEQEPVLPL